MELTFHKDSKRSGFSFLTLHENINGPEGGHLTESYDFVVSQDSMTVQRSVGSVLGDDSLSTYGVVIEDLWDLQTKEDCLSFLQSEEQELKQKLALLQELQEKLAELPLVVLDSVDDFEDEDEDEDEDE